MHARDLFEYAVIRVVPRVEREEFVNAGIILYCAKQRFLGVRYALDEGRICALSPEADTSAIGANLHSLQQISVGEKSCGPIALMDTASRFRWITAVRSTIVQTSRPHPGLCINAGEMLQQLFGQLVG